MLCDRMISFVDDWRQFCTIACNQQKGNPHALLAQGFMVDMLDQARSDWWPGLNHLQTKQIRAGVGNVPEITTLKDSWLALGEELGLDAKKERTRHEKEVRGRCAWRDCKYHREKPAEPKLFACKGCGEVRYCGRQCQKRYFCSRLLVPRPFIDSQTAATGRRADIRRCADA